MTSPPRPSPLTLSLLLLALACDTAREAPPPSGGLALGPAALAGGRYIVSVPGGLDTVTLSAGRHIDETTSAETLLLPLAAWGDLHGDDRREVATVIVTRVPGEGALHEMVVVADRRGRPVQIAHQFLGNGVDVEGLRIADRSVTVQMQVHRPDDPPCCPTERVSRRFTIQGRTPGP